MTARAPADGHTLVLATTALAGATFTGTVAFVAAEGSRESLTFRPELKVDNLGGVLSLTNLYIGLKSGWGFGVAITACILSYAIWSALHGIGLAKTKMTILENNCMQSTASAAGYSTVTDLARLRGRSTSQPRMTAMW